MFKKFVFYFFLLTLILPNVLLSFTEPLGVAGAIANVLLSGGIIYMLMSISPRLGRTIWLMFPLIFFAAFQIVLLSLYGRSIIAVDMFLNIVTTNAAEVSELLGNMFPIIGVVILLYVPSLVTACVFIRRKVRLGKGFLKRNRLAAGTVSIAGALALITAIFTEPSYAVSNDLYPLNVGYNIYLACDRTARTADYHETSAGFSYGAVATHPADERELYLLIIGETSRAENWQLLGYGRETNPRLSKRNDVMVCSQAYSESNTTHKSVPMLLSPVDAMTFGEYIYKVKSIITAFKDAGFATAFLSNQRYNHSFIDFFAMESDTVSFIKETGKINLSLDVNSRPDSELLPILDSIMAAGNKKQLVVLHTYGSHFNYRDRYSKEDIRFTPCDYDEAIKEQRPQLINAYDNTIVATDRFIADCISRLDSIEGLRGGILYTSDHGEDIFDDGSGNFLHASPRPSIHQVHVPMLAWLSRGYCESYPAKVSRMRSNMLKLVSTSRSYSPTALDMAGIKVSGSALTDTTASLCSPAYAARKPLYLSDHNEAVALKDIL